ncbi:hypothetical protein OESDEN_17241 [Oesophagostomum dentatum]|uniref:Uncharacterized protein n=1 Tax=Oesophagostomum dentatum TaxID=61180 RepID=A0A0B1SCN3_OESDE|nr:hypothetical protein OESDEN_17241 [Oesophagostomum dentatum]
MPAFESDGAEQVDSPLQDDCDKSKTQLLLVTEQCYG